MTKRKIPVGAAGDGPLWAFDEAAREDGEDLDAALDAAEEALQGMRAGNIDPARAAIAFERCAIGLQRHGADSAIGELPARSVLKLQKAPPVDHRRDWAAFNSDRPPQNPEAAGDEQLAELGLLAAPSVAVARTNEPLGMDEQFRRNAEISRRASARINAAPRGATNLDELCGL